MKTFDEIYNELENNNNEELNSAWIEAKEQNKKTKKIGLTIIAILDICIVLGLLKAKSIYGMLPVLPAIFTIYIITIAIIFIATKLGKKQAEFIRKYKNIVVKKIISNFYNNLEYFPEKPMPEYIYKNLGYEFYNKYSSNDYIEAEIDNKYSIQMAEILTEEKKEYQEVDGQWREITTGMFKDPNRETREETITKFNGLFAKIEIEKSIDSELRIMQDGKFAFDKNRLNMDSSEFEKYFDVKAANKILAMQILSADIMEELVEFENKTKLKYDVYIKNNNIYLRFHSANLQISAEDLKNGVLDKKIINKYFYLMNFTYNLSSKLINTINEVQI